MKSRSGDRDKGCKSVFKGVLDYLLESSSKKRYNLPCTPTAGVGDPRSQFLFWLHWGDLSRQHIPTDWIVGLDCSPVLINFVDGLTLSCHRNLSVAHYLGCTSGSALFLCLSYRKPCSPKHSPSHETPCLLLSFHCAEFIMTISRTHKAPATECTFSSFIS